MGIEPTRPAWKAGILPLNYTRINTVKRRYLFYQTEYHLSIERWKKELRIFAEVPGLVSPLCR